MKSGEAKIDVFFREAAIWSGIGPLVYLEIRKRVTNETAISVRDFFLKLWSDPKRGGPNCKWKVVIYPGGQRVETRLA